MSKVKPEIKKWAIKGVSVLCAVSLLSAGPARLTVFAQTSQEGNEGSKAGAIQAFEMRKEASIKEEALRIAKIVKKKIDLPNGKKDFSFDTYGEEGNIWHFIWRDQEDNWSMDVECDSEGRITGMNFHDYNKEKEDSPKFKYIGKELRKRMEEQLGKLIPSSKGNISITDYRYNSGNGEARFNVCRTVNGIPVPDNRIYVSMDCSTGVMTQMYGNWDYDVSFPKKENIISLKEAKEIGKKALGMELGYYLKTEIQKSSKKVSNNEENLKIKGILGYNPDKDYLAIDAFSGKVYESRPTEANGIYGDAGAADKEELAEDSVSSGAENKGELTSEEIEEIEKLDGVMDAEKAAAIVTSKEGLYHPAGMEYEYGQLYRKRINNVDSFYWTIRFRIKTDNENKGSVYANIDAKTGEIVQYSVYERNKSENTSSILSKEVLKEKAVSYMKGNYPLYADMVKCLDEADENYNYINGKKVLTGYSFGFIRYVNQLPCSQNYFNFTLTADKGEIYQINRYWSEVDVQFEGKDGIISVDKAKDYYFDSEEFELIYEINTKKDNTKSARLVYSTERIYPDIIKASNGKRMSEWGEVYKKASQEYKYSDIGKSEYREAIEFLAELKIGFDSDKFYPDRVITRGEMLELAEQSSLWRIDWMDLGENPSGKINRMELSHLILNSLGYEDVLKYSDIYSASFSDWNKIKKADRGYASLAGAMGLFWNGKKHLNGKFDADKPLTRGEAASLIMTLYRS